jgi:uncharacterized membrane protein YccC
MVRDPGIAWLTRHIDLPSLKAAVRAAIVVPAVFAFADGVIENDETTLFAVFGSFATLVLADFGGPWPRRLAAYLGLAATGFVLITLGTLCSETPWLAVVAMAVVGFVILISGVISGYFAAAEFAALLLFILPVGFPGPVSVIPDRLAGWALACSVCISAAMLLWPRRPPDVLRSRAARACQALADLMDAELSGDRSAIPEKGKAAGAAVADARKSFVATPYRPTGPTGPTEALAFLVDALEWVLSATSATEGPLHAELDPCRPENREVMTAATAVLRASEVNLGGGHQTPDLARLDRARDAAARALAQRIGELSLHAVPPLEAPQPSFRMREISFSVREIGVAALRASGVTSPELDLPEADRDQSRAGRAAARSRSTAKATGTLLLEHASPRSAVFRNSVRGAAALSVAVFVIQVASVQHAFWVVLATLSVLRSNALGTGATVFSAVAGTVVGIVVGGVLIYAIGTDEAVLWALLPFAILLAAYAPRAISFAAGQAGFTVVVLIIFNIIVPTGWTLGLLRVEDVAIGCGISLAVGVLFWPRGAEALVRQALGVAYARAADYVAAATQRLAGTAVPTEATTSSQRAARAAADRLDDSFRQYLTEPASRRANLDELGALVTGAVRLRLTAFSMSTLVPAPGDPAFQRCGESLTAEARAVDSWYAGFADAIERREKPPSPLQDGQAESPVVGCVREALASEPSTGPDSALSLLWASQHLEQLWRLAGELIGPATDPEAAPRAAPGRGPGI